MATYEELMNSAEQIRTNELPESNTHELVGKHLKNQVEHFNSENQGVKGQITALNKNTGISGYPVWKPNTAYAKGVVILNPDGQLVKNTVEQLDSGGTYNPVLWETTSLDKVNREKVAELDKDTNHFVFTDNVEFNKVIKHLFIDTTKYSGSFLLEGLKLTLLNRNTGDHLYGFRIKNKQNDIIGEFWNNYPEEPKYIELIKNGIYVYAEFYWSGMNDNSVIPEECNIKQIAFDSIGDKKRIHDTEISELNASIEQTDNKVTPLIPKVALISEGVTKNSSDIGKIQSTIKNTCLNQFVGIGTANPKLFMNRDEKTTNPKVENVVDDDSPFKDILGYYTVLSNTKTTGGTSFFSTSSDYIKERPKNIQFSFFTKKDDWDGILDGFELGLGLYSYKPTVLTADIKFDVKKVISGENIVGNLDAKTLNCNYTAKRGYNDDKYCQIILDIDVITWKLPEEAGIRPSIQLSWQQTKWINKSFVMINQQLLLDNRIGSGVFVCPDIENVIDFYYPETIDDRLNKHDEQIKDLYNRTKSQTKKNVLLYNSDEDAFSYITSPFNEDYDIELEFVCRRSYALSKNPCFNFNAVYLVNKKTGDKTEVHNNQDDIAPANFNSTYIGANHGCDAPRLVTCTNHGKTYADIGSEWTNGEHKFYIIGIIDENSLLIMGENSAAYPKWNFYKINKGESLSHLSGATNTDTISVENSVLYQLRPSLKIASLKAIVDGQEITGNGEYQFDELNICEIYDVFNAASILDKIKAKVGTYSSNPIYNELGADKVSRHSINYKFTSADKCFVGTNFIAYQDINMGYFGFTQQSVLSGQIKMYIPKALPIMSGEVKNDFRSIVDYNNVAADMRFTSEYWENPVLPPDRWIQASDNIAFNAGYLFDYGVGGDKRKDAVNNTFFLYVSRKIYPYGIDSKLTVKAGDVYDAVCFRIYSDINKFNKDGIINTNVFEYEGKLYIHADFNKAGFYDIDIPDKYIGKVVQVFENSDNVKLMTKISNSKLLIKVESSDPMYGYIVMQIVE